MDIVAFCRATADSKWTISHRNCTAMKASSWMGRLGQGHSKPARSKSENFCKVQIFIKYPGALQGHGEYLQLKEQWNECDFSIEHSCEVQNWVKEFDLFSVQLNVAVDGQCTLAFCVRVEQIQQHLVIYLIWCQLRKVSRFWIHAFIRFSVSLKVWTHFPWLRLLTIDLIHSLTTCFYI